MEYRQERPLQQPLFQPDRTTKPCHPLHNNRGGILISLRISHHISRTLNSDLGMGTGPIANTGINISNSGADPGRDLSGNLDIRLQLKDPGLRLLILLLSLYNNGVTACLFLEWAKAHLCGRQDHGFNTDLMENLTQDLSPWELK